MIDEFQEDPYVEGPKQSIIMDSMFQPFFAWCGIIFAGLITAAICWIAASVMSLKSDVAVLVARPEGVSRAEYMRDQLREERDLQELRARIK
jgi:hypothetical protein